MSDIASVSSAQAANLAADRSWVRKPRERRYPLGCKWQGTKRCGSRFMRTDGNLEKNRKKETASGDLEVKKAELLKTVLLL